MSEELKTYNEKIKNLELLADELTKKAPSENNIKSYMKRSGLEYHEDPMERINIVLKALQKQEQV